MKHKSTEYLFKDIAKFRYGKMPKKDKVLDIGKYPVYSGYRYVGYYDEYNTEAGQLIVVARGVGGTGDVKLTKEKCFLTNLSIAVEITANDVVIPEYLYYMFSLNNLRYLDSGSAQSQITISDLERLKITLPDVSVQCEIVSILKALDDKIALNQQINKNLEEQAQAIFASYFITDNLFETMKKLPLSDLCTTITKGTTPTTIGKPFVDSGINFIKAESILDNHSIDTAKFAFIDDDTNQQLKRSIIHNKDILFTIAGTLGRFAFVDNAVLPANTNQAVAIIRTNAEKITPEYLYSFFIGNWHNDYYTKRIQQAVQANLSLTTIKSLPIPILPTDSMKKYLSVIIPIIAMIKHNENENRRLMSTRDTLLPCLMSGEIDVSNIES